MVYSNSPRVHYNKPQLAEVICQLRFPTILSIGANDPAEFTRPWFAWSNSLFAEFVESALERGIL